MIQKQTKPEICYECYFFRERKLEMAHLCVNPQSYWCDKQGIGKATRACHHGKLNPELIKLYPHKYELRQHENSSQANEEG